MTTMTAKEALILDMLKKHGVTLAPCMTCIFREDHGILPKEFEEFGDHYREDIERRLWIIRTKRMDAAFRELRIDTSVHERELDFLTKDECNSPEQFARKIAEMLPG